MSDWLPAIAAFPALIAAGAVLLTVGLLVRLRVERTARRAAEVRLHESEARLQTAIDNLPCDFWMMDGGQRYTLLNAASREHWGDHVGRRLDELQLAATTRAEWTEVNQRAFAGQVVRQLVTHELRGKIHHFLSTVAPVRVDGTIIGILGVNFDITDRVAAEEALRKSEEKLALHVRHTPLAVIEWNLAFEVVAWNPSAERIFGYTAAEAMGRNAVGFIVPESGRMEVERIWAALLTHKGGTRNANENLIKSGRSVLCEWYNTPLVDATGAVIGVASSVQDITERNVLENQLRQAQKLESIGQLAGGVAHEFNNLLTPMLVQTDMLAFHYENDPRLCAMLHPIREAIQQAAELNRRILAVGRRAGERRELQGLNPLVENALVLLRPSLDRRIGLSISLAPKLEPLLVDRTAITQIVMNLTLNARDTVMEKLGRSPPVGWSPRLTISTTLASSQDRREGTSAPPFPIPFQRLTVTDNGLGIEPQLHGKVFEPFFTTKEPGQGTGLGLAVVWSVAHSLGGWVEFEPGPGGEGTSFHVYLPHPDVPSALVGVAPTAAVGPEFRVGRKSAHALRVLLAEDNSLVAETMSTLLMASGHTVTTTQDGLQAWQLFERRPGQFDLVLADYNMPGLTGGDLVQRIRGTGFSGRIVVVSGYLALEKLEELKRLGVDAVLHKPFMPTKLLAAIDGRT